jgi:ribosomal 50S subunit-recycling heat shock protein
VKPGDIVVLSLGHRTIKFEVVGEAQHVTAKEAPGLYRLLED